MSVRCCVLTSLFILSGTVAGCSGGGDDAQQDSDANDIVYPPSRLADTSHPGVVSAIRPFLSRVHPEDPKRVAVHFSTRFGPGEGRGIWAEKVYWDTTLASLTVEIKTPGGKTFTVRRQPGEAARLAEAAKETYYMYRRQLKQSPTIIFDLPSSALHSRGGQIALEKPDKLDMSIEGTYNISVRGTLDFRSEDTADIEFATAEITLEVTSDGVASINAAIAAATKAAGDLGRNPKFNMQSYPAEDEHGNRVLRYSAGDSDNGNEWAYKQASVLIRPDGTLERIAYRNIDTCVAEGSLVETEQGPVPIEQLIIGTKIWGFDLDRGLNVLTPVRQIRTHIAPRTLRFPSGLRVTADHPIWAADSWKQARDLRSDDLLRRYDGSQEPAGTPVIVASPIRVYDLTVDAPHNFFAANVLVHNKKRGYSPFHDDLWYFLWPQRERPADSKQAQKANRVEKVGGDLQTRDDGGVRLYFDRRSKVTAADLVAIAGLKSVKDISISKEGSITDEVLKSLRGFDELERLSLSKCSLTDASIVHLQQLSKLSDLDVPLKGLSEEGFRRLGRLTGLKSLSIDFIPDKASVDHLKSLHQLEKLEVSGETIKDDCLEMVGSLSELKELSLVSTSIQGPGMIHLGKLKKLEQLRVYSCGDISGQSMRVLGKLQSLKYLGLDHSATGGWCDSLTDATSLESLHLDYAGITATDVKHLGTLTQLKHLSLVGAEMTDADLQHLHGMKKLQSLSLPKQITDAGLKRIQTKLPKCKVERYSF